MFNNDPGDIPESNQSTLLPDGYVFVGLLGEGGTGLAVKAIQANTDRVVTIKFLKADLTHGSAHDRFRQEAKILSNLSHPNIQKVLGYAIDKDNRPYIVLEHLEGKDLKTILQEVKRLKPGEFMNVFQQCAAALEYLHSQGIVHRDLKPGNIIVSSDSNGNRAVRLIDFGLAKITSAEPDRQKFTQTGALLGSPRYMSPEQCKGCLADGRTDIFSLGLVMFECIDGEPPQSATSDMEMLLRRMNENIVKSPRIPRKLWKVMGEMLQRDPERRSITAATVLKSLKALDASGIQNEISLAGDKRFKIALCSLAAAVLAALVVFCALKLSGTKSGSPTAQYTKSSLSEKFKQFNVLFERSRKSSNASTLQNLAEKARQEGLKLVEDASSIASQPKAVSYQVYYMLGEISKRQAEVASEAAEKQKYWKEAVTSFSKAAQYALDENGNYSPEGEAALREWGVALLNDQRPEEALKVWFDAIASLEREQEPRTTRPSGGARFELPKTAHGRHTSEGLARLHSQVASTMAEAGNRDCLKHFDEAEKLFRLQRYPMTQDKCRLLCEKAGFFHRLRQEDKCTRILDELEPQVAERKGFPPQNDQQAMAWTFLLHRSVNVADCDRGARCLSPLQALCSGGIRLAQNRDSISRNVSNAREKFESRGRKKDTEICDAIISSLKTKSPIED